MPNRRGDGEAACPKERSIRILAHIR